MRLRVALVLAGAAIGCSGLTEEEAGVVGIEVRVPGPDTVEVGETIQLTAVPLNKNGDSTATTVVWVSADPTATVDAATGLLTGVSPGTARVQATVGSLASEFITFAVIAPADSIAIVGDSIFSVTPDDAAVLPNLTTVLGSNHPPGALPGRPIIYTITSPDPAAATPVVLLGGNVVSDTILTGSDGTAVATLVKQAGVAPPDSVVVTVSAERTRHAIVPGSGQRFIVRFATP